MEEKEIAPYQQDMLSAFEELSRRVSLLEKELAIIHDQAGAWSVTFRTVRALDINMEDLKKEIGELKALLMGNEQKLQAIVPLEEPLKKIVAAYDEGQKRSERIWKSAMQGLGVVLAGALVMAGDIIKQNYNSLARDPLLLAPYFGAFIVLGGLLVIVRAWYPTPPVERPPKDQGAS